jgi:hypothetical protein
MRQTKVVTKILAAALALGVCGIANATSTSTATKHSHSGVHGVILSVQRAENQITVRTGSAKKGNLNTFKITIGNGVTVQGKKNASGISALHAGDKVIIEPDTSNPTTIVDMGGAKRAHVHRV